LEWHRCQFSCCLSQHHVTVLSASGLAREAGSACAPATPQMKAVGPLGEAKWEMRCSPLHFALLALSIGAIGMAGIESRSPRDLDCGVRCCRQACLSSWGCFRITAACRWWAPLRPPSTWTSTLCRPISSYMRQPGRRDFGGRVQRCRGAAPTHQWKQEDRVRPVWHAGPDIRILFGDHTWHPYSSNGPGRL
jgi:hypothetical protein